MLCFHSGRQWGSAGRLRNSFIHHKLHGISEVTTFAGDTKLFRAMKPKAGCEKL